MHLENYCNVCHFIKLFVVIYKHGSTRVSRRNLLPSSEVLLPQTVHHYQLLYKADMAVIKSCKNWWKRWNILHESYIQYTFCRRANSGLQFDDGVADNVCLFHQIPPLRAFYKSFHYRYGETKNLGEIRTSQRMEKRANQLNKVILISTTGGNLDPMLHLHDRLQG